MGQQVECAGPGSEELLVNGGLLRHEALVHEGHRRDLLLHHIRRAGGDRVPRRCARELGNRCRHSGVHRLIDCGGVWYFLGRPVAFRHRVKHRGQCWCRRHRLVGNHELCAPADGRSVSRERHHRAVDGAALRRVLAQPGSERVVINLDTDGDQSRAHIEELPNAAVAAVEVQRKNIFAQDLANEVGACPGRTMLDKDPNAIVVGRADCRREVDGRLGLPRDRCSTVLGADVVGPTNTVRIEPDPWCGSDVTRMDVEPRLVERGGNLWDMAGKVVSDRATALRSKGVDDPTAHLRVTGDHEVAFGVDQHEVDVGLVGNCGAHIVDRSEHVPHSPVGSVDVPRPGDGIEVDGDLIGEHSRLVDLAPHCVHVAPYAEGIKHVALT